MKLYRFLTGPDDSSFCHRVSEAISNGWELYGTPTLVYDSQRESLICGQAVIKEVPGENYQPDMKLSQY